jgi:protein TonB
MTAAAIRHLPADFLGARLGEYGAAELKRLEPVYLRRALLLSCLIALTAVSLALLAAALFRHAEIAQPPTVFLPHDFAPPPSVEQNRITPVVISPGATPPAFATPVPVPDVDAPVGLTIATQDQLGSIGPTVTPGEGPSAVVVKPQEEPDPDPAVFTYAEEYPVPITQARPEYPEVARQSGLQGIVIVRALVGTDGRVRRVEVEKSIPILDDAAVTAVRQWVFKPALSNNRPVKVWVRVPVNFRLH